jgi:serine/threonine-protein kinase
VSADSPPPKQVRQFANYEILSLLGKGGMSEVYRARVLSGPREGWFVAIKRLLPELAKDESYVDQFTTEADLTKLLEHPNIVKVLEVGVVRDVYFIVMELVDGRDVGQIVKRCKKRGIQLPVDFALFLAKTLLDALAYAHQAKSANGQVLGIVHCDISPSNLFVSRTGEIKLGDFGVAHARARVVQTQDTVAGKPHYLSPEILKGAVTPQVDLWAAAVSLYELLTLERPFNGKTFEEVCVAIRGRQCVPLHHLRPEAPAALEQIFQRAFAASPEARFASAEAFAAALEPLYDERVGNPLAIAALVRGLFGVPSAEG